MNRIFALVLVVGMFCLPMVRAEEEESASLLEFEIVPKILSQYIGDQGAVYYDKPVVQTDFTVSMPLGFYLNWWSSLGLDDSDLSSNEGDELDYTLGWAGEVFGLSLDTGIAYFDAYELGTMPGDTVQLFVEVSKDGLINYGPGQVTPYCGAKVHLPAKDNDPEGGEFYLAGARHEMEISDKLSTEQNIYALYDTGVFGYEEGINLRCDISLSYAVSDSFSINFPEFTVSTPVHDADDRETELVWGGGVTATF